MDVARAPKKKTGRNIGIAAGVVVVVLATIALSKLPTASPTVERATLLMDSVRLGDVTREVRGPGTLVPERIRWITALASARVERLVTQSGDQVAAGSVLLEMSNPDLQIQTLQAEGQVRQSQIELLNLKTNLQSQLLSQEGLVASTRTQYISTTQEAQAADSLVKLGLVPQFEATNRKAQAEELTKRYEIEQKRLALMKQAIDSQISVQAAQVQQLKAIAANQQARLSSLSVRAPETGVLQDLTLQLGQWVAEGTTLARVVQPGQLKAVLRIPESQAKDVQIGQRASIDTRNGIVAGRVSRKDPAAIAGTVTIDVALEGELPAGAVPDLSIDGTIEIEKLTNVLYTGRPVRGGGTGLVGLFKVVDDGDAAERVQVQVGRTSVNSVEIVRGLSKGDRIILSDMSQYDGTSRVRIK